MVHSGDCRPAAAAAAAAGAGAAASQSTPAFNGRNEESIVIDIARLPPHQHSVALCVVSASGHPLGAANAAEVTLTAFPAFPNLPSSATTSAASPSKRRPITPNALSGTPVRRSEQQGKTVGLFSLTAGNQTTFFNTTNNVFSKVVQLDILEFFLTLNSHGNLGGALLHHPQVRLLPLHAHVHYLLCHPQRDRVAASAVECCVAGHQLLAHGAQDRTHAAAGSE